MVLDDGTEVRATRVISSMDAKRTFLKCVEERHLPGDFVQAVRKFKTRGHPAS